MYKFICQKKNYAIKNWTQKFCPDIRTRWDMSWIISPNDCV